MGISHHFRHQRNGWRDTAQKLSFPLGILSVNVNESAGNCGFGNIYWRYVDEKIKERVEVVKAPSETAKSELLAAQNCFVSGFKNKKNYVMRMIPDISSYLK